MKTTKSFNVQIWVGLREGYGSNIFSIEDVRKICDEYVNEEKDCITITPTEFMYVNGWEPGVIIGFINYPRFPREEYIITDRAFVLASLLKKGLKQFRVSIVTPTETYMLEDE